jgi:hypothetical protein
MTEPASKLTKPKDSLGIDRLKLGLDERCAAEIRSRVLVLSHVWDDPALDVYNALLTNDAPSKTR